MDTATSQEATSLPTSSDTIVTQDFSRVIGRRGFQPWRDTAHGHLRSLFAIIVVMTTAMTMTITKTHVTTNNNNNTPTHHTTNDHNDRRHAPYDNDSDLTLYDLGVLSDKFWLRHWL